MERFRTIAVLLCAALLAGGCAHRQEPKVISHIRVLPNQAYHNAIALTAGHLGWTVCQYGPKAYRLGQIQKNAPPVVVRVLYTDFGYVVEPDIARIDQKTDVSAVRRAIDGAVVRIDRSLERTIPYGRIIEEWIPVESCAVERVSAIIPPPEARQGEP